MDWGFEMPQKTKYMSQEYKDQLLNSFTEHDGAGPHE